MLGTSHGLVTVSLLDVWLFWATSGDTMSQYLKVVTYNVTILEGGNNNNL